MSIGTNQKIGSTISNIASLLVPIGAEEKAGVDAAEALQGAVDLGIPGSESTTRVVKKVGDNTADHFANKAEANAVAEKMKDKEWLDANCGVCGVLPAPLGDVVAKGKRSSSGHLGRRGVIAASCCPAPKTLVPNVAESGDEAESPEPIRGLVHNPEDYRGITEADLHVPPFFTIRDIHYDEDVRDLSTDLSRYSTGAVTFSPGQTDVMTSDQALAFLRKGFTAPPDDSLYQALQIRSRDDGLRMYIRSDRLLKSNNPMLQRLQSFLTASITHGKEVVSKLKSLSAEDAQNLDAEAEFFYVPPNPKSLTGTDPRGFHIDGGIMQFGMADVEGLIVASTATRHAFRLPVEPNAFYLLKARFWDIQAWYHKTPEGPTWHSVFGPQMAEQGRVSMIMTIYKKKVKDW